MRQPNFFIIGAPSCGTTSMACWLAEHPSVFMSLIKEPHYFNTDHSEHRFTNSLKDYERLFHKATDQHITVGEASAGYLYFEEAVPNILAYNSDAKFLVMVRNPVDMACSMHDQRCLGVHVESRDFATEWQLQAQRANRKADGEPERKRPALPPYGKMCQLGEQLERLYSRVPREQVHVVVFDDLKSDTRNEYKRVLDFLRVPGDGRLHFPIHNQAREIRSLQLTKLMARLAGLKSRLGIRRSLGANAALLHLITRRRTRPVLAAEMRATLVEYFREDVQLLHELLRRDLSSWMS